LRLFTNGFNKDSVLLQHITLVIGLVCVGIGQTLLYTILGPASRTIGLSEVGVGTIVTSAALIITVASGLWGGVITKVGSKTAYAAGMACYTLGSFSLAYAIGLSIENTFSVTLVFYLLLGIRCVTGFLTAGIHPSAMTYISESTSREKRSAAIALISSAYGIGSIIGPMLGSFMGGGSLLLPLYVAGIISLLGTVMGLIFLKGKDVHIEVNKNKVRSVKLTDTRTLPILIAIALTYVSFSAYQQTISFYVQDNLNVSPNQSVVLTGYAVSIMAVCMVVTQLFYIQAFKPKPKSLLLFGLFSCVIGFLLLVLFSKVLLFIYVESGFLGIGFGMMIPAIQSSASLAVNEDEQGGVAGFLFGASAFGYVIGPLLATYVYSVNSKILFSVCILASMISALSTLKIINNRNF